MEGERMTYEEAIKNINALNAVCGQKGLYDAEFENALALAIEALEKQIPKKPLHMHKNYYCPICKEDGWMLWDDAIPNDMDEYCGKCGQAIDWSDDE